MTPTPGAHQPRPTLPTRPSPRWSSWAMLSVTTLALVGCFGPRNFTNDNDRLRARNLKLTRQVQNLQHLLTLQRSHAAALEQQLRRKPVRMPTAVLPQLSALDLARFSGIVLATKDQPRDTLRLYLRTLDQHGRMLPVAGKATVKVIIIPDKGAPRQIAKKTFAPKAFDHAYRASLMGSHYSLVLPLPPLKTLPTSVDQVTVKIVFTQADTGVKLTTQKTFPLPKTRD